MLLLSSCYRAGGTFGLEPSLLLLPATAIYLESSAPTSCFGNLGVLQLPASLFVEMSLVPEPLALSSTLTLNKELFPAAQCAPWSLLHRSDCQVQLPTLG